MARSVVVSKVDVKMKPNVLIAEQLFAPTEKIPIQVWGKTRTVAAIARRLAPYRKGVLRQDIMARRDPSSPRSAPVYEVTTGLKYSGPMEFGFVHWRSGRFIPGHHFLRDALRSVRW